MSNGDIDRRIEGLTQSVELLAAMHKDNEARMDRYMSQITEAITRLTNIVGNHEHRLRDLEDHG